MINKFQNIKEYINLLKPHEIRNLLDEWSLHELIENWDKFTEEESIVIFKNLNLEMKVNLKNSFS